MRSGVEGHIEQKPLRFIPTMRLVSKKWYVFQQNKGIFAQNFFTNVIVIYLRGEHEGGRGGYNHK